MMTTMINANFSKQDTQNAQGADALDKDQKSDDFTALIAGFCADPKPPKPETPVIKAAEPANPVATDGEEPGGKLPVYDAQHSSLAQIMEPVKNGPQVIVDPAPPTPTTAADTRDDVKQDQPAIPPRGCQFPMPSFSDGPIVKDIKSMANAFEPALSTASGPISAGHTLSDMVKEKAAVLAAMTANNGATTQSQSTADTPLPDTLMNNSLSEYNYAIDPVKVAEMVKDHAPRKLSKLISEVSEAATTIDSVISTAAKAETAPLAETESIHRMTTAILEQVQPKMMELASAVVTEGKQVLKMRLHPAELGTVEIHLEKNDAGVLQAHLHTDNETAKHILNQGLGQLRTSLENAGWQVGQMQISTSLSSAGEGSNGKNAQQRDAYSPNSTGAHAEQPMQTSDDPSQFSADRLVSLRA